MPRAEREDASNFEEIEEIFAELDWAILRQSMKAGAKAWRDYNEAKSREIERS